MKEESRFPEQIASIQAGLGAAVKPLLCEAAASREAIANLLDQTLSLSAYIASLSILRVAHVPALPEGESEEREPAFSPAISSADGPPPPVNVAVAVHFSPISAFFSEVERCVTGMIEKIPPVQADLATLVSIPVSPVASERPPTEGGTYPLPPEKSKLPPELQKVLSETTLRDVRTTLLASGRPPELQKVSPERMLRDLPATLLTGIAADEALTGPLFAPPDTVAPVHHHLRAGRGPEETGGSGEPPARQPLAISPLMLLRRIMQPAQQEIPSRSISPFPHGIAPPAGREAPPAISPVWQKILSPPAAQRGEESRGESPETASMYGEAGFTEKRSVVQLSPLHVFSSLIAPQGAPGGTGGLPLPPTVSPALPVRLLSQSVPYEGSAQPEPAPDAGLSAGAPPRADAPVPAAMDARSPRIAPFTPPLPVKFLNEAAAARGGRGQPVPPPSRPAGGGTRSIVPVEREAKTAVHPPGIALDRSGGGLANTQAVIARSLLNPILVPSTVSIAAFSPPMAQDGGGESVAPPPLAGVANTLHAPEGGGAFPGPVPLPSLPLNILTSTAPFTARKGESALNESLSRVHPARFLLSLLTGQGEGGGGPPEPLLFPAAGASQAMLGIHAAYGPVLPHAGFCPPQEGREGGYPGLTQLQQMISVYSGAGGQVQAGSPLAGGLQPATAIANVFQPPAPPVKVTPPDIRKAAEATARQSSQPGDRPLTFHNNFEITVQVRGGGIDGDMHELGRKIGSILADEMRRHGGI